jgi:phage terminase large subunit-like protein
VQSIKIGSETLLRAMMPALAEHTRVIHNARHRFVWRRHARPEQIPPGEPGAKVDRRGWDYWFIRAGRGWGKTRTGAEAVREQVITGRRRSVALIAPTLGDGRKLMIFGPSGIMECSAPNERPVWHERDRELLWPNGARGYLYSSEEPDRLRGGNHDYLWADELASWRNDNMTWAMARFALRITGPQGDVPQAIITTTPRPTPLVRKLLADPKSVVQDGTTYDNVANLSAHFLNTIREEYEGTRLGEQELLGKVLGDTPGALWKLSQIEALRVVQAPLDFVRIVVAIDPAMADPEERRLAREDGEHVIAETGIVVVGRARCLCRPGRDEQHAFVLQDLSGYHSPDAWARTAIEAYETFKADRIIGEQNNGGALVEANVRAQREGQRISYRGVYASRGKQSRAEPIATLYEKGVVHHVGTLAKLEDQMTTWSPLLARKSPDRMDALVWGLTELMLSPGTNLAGSGSRAIMTAPRRC